MRELSNVLQDNDTEMDIVCCGGRGIFFVKMSLFGHLPYDRFNQNLKSNNFIHPILESLSNNVEGTVSSSLILIAKYYIDEFTSVAGDSGLTFAGQISAIKTASMMNDIGINISQLRILLRILRHKIGAKLFEPETKTTDLCGEMIVPQIW